MRFIKPEEFGEIISKDLGNSLTAKDIDLISQELHSKEVSLTEQKQDVLVFLDFLNQPRNLVFYNWTIQNKELLNACLHIELKLFDPSNKSFYLHAERNNFYIFLTPFVAPFVTQKINQDSIQSIYHTMFYTQFLSTEKKIEVQGAIKSNMDRLLDEISSKSDLSLIYNVLFLKSLNLLDRTFYNGRLKYTRKVGELLLDEDIAFIEKQKIATAARKLSLNDEHKDDLEKFINKAGVNQIKASLTKSAKKKSIIFLTVTVIAILLIYLINSDSGVEDNGEMKIIPPYGTDSLSEQEIDYLNDLFRLELDSVYQDSIQVGVEMEDIFLDTIK
jgi:hypothetical protein